MELTLIITASSLALVLGAAISRMKKKIGSKDALLEAAGRESRLMKSQIESRDKKIKELQAEGERLNKLNDKYLTFMLRIPEITKRLSADLDFDETILTVAGLINDVISTDTVEIYINEDARLKKVYPPGEKVSHALGEGFVGRAGRDGIAKIKGVTDKGIGISYGPGEEKLWMAVPIMFHDILLGVLAVGHVRHGTGNEKDVLKLISDIAGAALSNQRVIGDAKKEASTDPLTGLYNRRSFFDRAHREVHRAGEDHVPVSFFIFDIDNFKNYNDSNGHPEGDRLLRELSDLIRGVTRKTAPIARYGGEEFVVMLPGASKQDGLTYADRFRQMVASHPFRHREKQPMGVVSISGGVATFPSDGRSVEELVKLADDALYRAKREGRNRVRAH